MAPRAAALSRAPASRTAGVSPRPSSQRAWCRWSCPCVVQNHQAAASTMIRMSSHNHHRLCLSLRLNRNLGHAINSPLSRVNGGWRRVRADVTLSNGRSGRAVRRRNRRLAAAGREALRPARGPHDDPRQPQAAGDADIRGHVGDVEHERHRPPSLSARKSGTPDAEPSMLARLPIPAPAMRPSDSGAPRSSRARREETAIESSTATTRGGDVDLPRQRAERDAEGAERVVHDLDAERPAEQRICSPDQRVTASHLVTRSPYGDEAGHDGKGGAARDGRRRHGARRAMSDGTANDDNTMRPHTGTTTPRMRASPSMPWKRCRKLTVLQVLRSSSQVLARYRVSSSNRWTVVPSPSQMQCERFGIVHHRERPVRGDERVDQRFGVLEVHVVVAGAVHDEQVAAQVRREGDRRSRAVAVRVLLRQAHVALLVDRVVEALVASPAPRPCPCCTAPASGT